jgi:ubiquitin carboxyl-terminal hydrolase 4/11/15
MISETVVEAIEN